MITRNREKKIKQLEQEKSELNKKLEQTTKDIDHIKQQYNDQMQKFSDYEFLKNFYNQAQRETREMLQKINSIESPQVSSLHMSTLEFNHVQQYSDV